MASDETKSEQISFKVDEKMGSRLRGPPNQFKAEAMVELQCEILGFERNFKETRSVQVDFMNRQITGL